MKDWSWYHLRRTYRVSDEVYMRAPRASEVKLIHWENFGGIGYAFDEAAAVYATEPDLAEDARGELAPIRLGRVRRLDVWDVPAWMVRAAISLDHRTHAAQPLTEEIEGAVDTWNRSTGNPEDAPLRQFRVSA